MTAEKTGFGCSPIGETLHIAAKPILQHSISIYKNER